ncbi:hypothetical protein QOT17_004017 [Balamuthia mandrillaris]
MPKATTEEKLAQAKKEHKATKKKLREATRTIEEQKKQIEELFQRLARLEEANSNKKEEAAAAAGAAGEPSPRAGKQSSKKKSGKKSKKAKEREANKEEEDMIPEPALSFTLPGQWVKGQTDGGCFNTASWKKNPQFFLSAPQTTQIDIVLEQDNPEEEQVAIGFYVLKSDGTGRQLMGGQPHSLLLAKTSFGVRQQITTTMEVEGTELPYIIIPCTFDEGEAGSFRLTVTSNSAPILLEGLTKRRKWDEAIAEGQWTEETAGGCKNNLTFVNNPQFLLSLEKKTDVNVTLLQSEKDDFDSLGLYIIQCEDRVTKKLVNVTNESVVSKSRFASHEEVDMRLILPAGHYVVVPCTFDPNYLAKFTIKILSDNPIQLNELGASQGITMEGSWRGQTAGGCMNHTSWRSNQQYFLTVKETMTLTIKLRTDEEAISIGYYILKSDKGLRRMRVKREHLVYKSGFFEAKEISNEVTLEASEHPYILLPCAFEPHMEADYTLSLFARGEGNEDNFSIRPCDDPLSAYSLPGEWNAITGGGCMSFETWRNNPQYIFKSEKSTVVNVLLAQPRDRENMKSIGFYVIDTGDEQPRSIISAKETEIVARGKFRRQKDVSTEFNAEAGRVYVIIPCLFYPRQEHPYVITCYAPESEGVTFVPIAAAPPIIIVDQWTAETSGGCMNNSTWNQNPHLALTVKQACKATILLVQVSENPKQMEWEAIGFYVTKGDKWGFPKLQSAEDLLGKANFEEAPSVALEMSLEPDEHPYIITPCTFHAGHEGPFYVQVFTSEEDREKLSLDEVDYTPYIQMLESGEEEQQQESSDKEVDAEKGSNVETPKEELKEQHEEDKETEPEKQKEAATESQATADIAEPSSSAEDGNEANQSTSGNEGGQPQGEAKPEEQASTKAAPPPSVTVEDTEARAENARLKDEVAELKKELEQVRNQLSQALSELEQQRANANKQTTSSVPEPPSSTPSALPPPPPPTIAPPPSSSAGASPPPPPPLISFNNKDGGLSTNLAAAAAGLKKASPKELPAVSPREQMLTDLLKGGHKLKSAANRVLAPPPPKTSTFSFNMEKITARREAIEMSDDEDEDGFDGEWD